MLKFKLFGKPVFHPLNIILILNFSVFLIQLSAEMKMRFVFALTPELFWSGYYWQVLTYGFLHSPNLLLHIMMNMYFMFMIGTYLESFMGKVQLTLLYFISLLGGGLIILAYSGLAQVLAQPEFAAILRITPTLGASGAVFGFLTVYGILFPDREVYLFFFIPVKAKNIVWVALISGFVIEIAFEKSSVSNTGHLGGALFGYLYFVFFIKNKIGKNIIENLVENVTNLEKKLNETIGEVKKVQTDQTKINQKLKLDILALNNFSEKENFLNPLQVANANICSPPTYNPEDSYCLNCEWFANCMLRKVKIENK